MNTNKPSNSDTPPAPSLIRRILKCLEEWWARQTKIAVASHMGGILLWVIGWFNYAAHLASLKIAGHPSQAGERFFCEFFLWITLAFFIVWTFLCFRWRKVRQGDKKVPPQTRYGQHRILQCLEEWWARQTKIAVSTYFFGFIMWILVWVNYAIHLATLKMDGHPSQGGERFFYEFFPWITLAFFIVWTFLCFRWRKVRQGDKKIPPGAFLFTVVVTVWLSLFMAVSPCAAANSWQTNTNTVPQMGQTVQVASTPANSPHPHVILSDGLAPILWTRDV